jgi:hypothetical protein
LSADRPSDTTSLERTGQGLLRNDQGARWGSSQSEAARCFFEPVDGVSRHRQTG